MLLARPKVFEETDDPTLKVQQWQWGQHEPPKYQCQPAQLHHVWTHRLEYEKSVRKIWKPTSSFESFFI